MKAIIIAAGRGQRLAPVTDDAPKCLTEVNGQSILDRALDAFRQNGITELCAVRGYRGEMLEGRGLRLFDNPHFRDNNILSSLFYAEEAMHGPFLSTYSDIVFHPGVVTRLLATPGDIVLVVDRQWTLAYEGRTLHPIAEGEVCRVENGQVSAVGKGVPAEGALGEFIGLAKYSARGADRMREVYAELRQRYAGREDQPFQRAKEFRKAYLTDLYNELISRGEALQVCEIDQQWCEIDTLQDLERAQRTIAW
jgi:phosphoenolpyruvate phosphomutase